MFGCRRIIQQNRDEVVLLTGKIPLLLTLYERVYQNGDSWERVVERALLEGLDQDWAQFLMHFCGKLDADQVWKVVSRTGNPVKDHDIVDYRYFYFGNASKLCSASEFFMRLVYQPEQRKAGTDAFNRWPSILNRSRLSVLAFQVQEIIKAQVYHVGVKGKYPKRVKREIKGVPFCPGYGVDVLRYSFPSVFREWFLLVLLTFSFAGVDMVQITDTAVVGIQVTTIYLLGPSSRSDGN